MTAKRKAGIVLALNSLKLVEVLLAPIPLLPVGHRVGALREIAGLTQLIEVLSLALAFSND